LGKKKKKEKKKKGETEVCIKTLEITIIFPVSRNGYSWLQQSSWALLTFLF